MRIWRMRPGLSTFINSLEERKRSLDADKEEGKKSCYKMRLLLLMPSRDFKRSNFFSRLQIGIYNTLHKFNSDQYVIVVIKRKFYI